MEAPAKVAEECKAKVVGFQELLPLITAICNGGLHERHWEQIAAVVGFDVRPDEVTSLRRLLDYNIQDHVKVMAVCPDRASIFAWCLLASLAHLISADTCKSECNATRCCDL